MFGLGIRLLFLGRNSFWLDEANSLRVTLLGQQALWAGQSEGYHPPLFYWVLEQWVQFGRSEFHLRLIAVIPATLSIPVLYLLAKEWFDKYVAMTAAALMAVSPLLVWFSQEARPYALLSFFGLLIMLAVTKLFRQPKFLWWLLFVVMMTAALYLHYFAILLIPFQLGLFLVFLATKRTTWKPAIYWLVGLFFVTVAWWPWLQTPPFTRFLGFATTDRNYFVHLINRYLDFSSNLSIVLGIVLGITLLFGLFTWLIFFKLNLFSTIQNFFQNLREQTWAQLAVGFLYVLILVISVYPRGYSIKRQLILFWPFLLLGFAYFGPWKKQNRTWLATILTLSFIASVINIAVIPKPDWRAANAYITQHQQAGDIVLLEPSYMTIPFDYYNGGHTNQKGKAFGVEPDAMQTILDENERIWLIIHGSDYDAEQRTIDWLNQHAELQDSIDVYRIHIRLYESEAMSE